MLKVANEVSGVINEKYNGVEYYFQLKKTNEALFNENVRLRNMLGSNVEFPDTSKIVVFDTTKTISPKSPYQKYIWKGAKVVNNSVTSQTNFITIRRGTGQGVDKGMAVVSPEGVVGVVVNASENFSVVMSMLHRQNGISAKLKKTEETGSIGWDGKSPLEVTLKNIPKSVQVEIGDSVLTSQYSDVYPSGILVGTIKEVTADKASNFYTLKVKPATNFFNLEYVYVVENLQKDEKLKLEAETKKSQ